MDFDYKSRRELAEKYKEKWEKKNKLALALLSKEDKQLVEDIFAGRGEVLNKIIKDNTEVKSLSEFMKENYKKIVELFVPKEFRKDYYNMLDKCNRFQYAGSRYRRSVRTANYGPHVADAFMLLKSYYTFAIYECGINKITRFLRDEMSEELVDLKYNGSYISTLSNEKFDEIFAARIDAGDRAVIEAVKDMFLSENNTVVVTRWLIRAVVKASDAKLHELLGKFLLAARLSEGVRQVICENADCGTEEAFFVILDVIKDNNLIRFAAVKRAIATWTGVCNEESMDRITGKVLEDIILSVRDREQAKAFVQSEDAVHIVIGLWSMGFYEVEDAIAEMREILIRNNRVQLLAMSYYNLSFENPAITRKIALEVIEKYDEDLELAAAYLPTYLSNADEYIFELYKAIENEHKKKYVPVEYIFDSREQAEKHFHILKDIYEGMKKKKVEYSPLVFPWYGVVLSKHDLLLRMSLIAEMLDENELRDYVCTRFDDLNNDYYSRARHIVVHLHEPKTELQRKALIDYVASKETSSRSAALKLLQELITQKKITLTEEEYQVIEGFLRFKNEGIRKNAITLLNMRDDEGLKASIERLIASDTSLIRLAGLDLIRTRKQKTNDEFAQSLISKVQEIEEPTGEEQILIEEICGQGGADAILNEKGYGLYNPDTVAPDVPFQADVSVCKDFFHVPAKQVTKLFEQLYAFIDEHAELEYTNASGEECLLGNVSNYGWRLNNISWDNSLKMHERFPFPELWREFYDTYVKTPNALISMYISYLAGTTAEMAKEQIATCIYHEKKIFGEISSDYMRPASKYTNGYNSGIKTVILCMMSMNDITMPKEVAKQAVAYAALEMPKEALWYDYDKNSDKGRWKEYEGISFTNSSRFSECISILKKWNSDDEFKEVFLLLYQLDKQNAIWERPNQARGVYYGSGSKNQNFLNIYYYVKAYTMGIIAEDMVYKAAFEMIGIRNAVIELGIFMKEKLNRYEKIQLEGFIRGEEPDREDAFWKAGVKIYKRIIDTILNVELKRGDSETIFSRTAMSINKVYGMDRLIAILKALGKSTLDRKGYYYYFYGSQFGKKEVLSHLLFVCEPVQGDTGEKLKEAARESKISEERLIEVAMYAPQWLDIVEECLGYSGLKSGCYYFMAHMNESFDDKKAAMIAKYTPLSKEELNGGCFDVKWFYEAHEELGEKLFDKLYNSAKYISDGSKHSRARKYADAALNRVTVEELETAINDKRNKDLLMSYGIIPVKDTEDILHRYEFLQKFKKESKQFGAQRRASEAAAVSYALKNLATSAGYSDETRLILAMETELVKGNMQYFNGIDIEGYQIGIAIDVMGKVSMCYEKAGKKLKSAPAALKKNEQYLVIKAFHDKLKAQYSRTVAMFEASMEDRDVYSFGELVMLCQNPVTKRIVENLVYITVAENHADISGESGTDNIVSDSSDNAGDCIMCVEGKIGIITDNIYMDVSGDSIAMDKDTKLRIAHPFDLYHQGVWTAYQRLFFDRSSKQGIKQPFKQVFRELYVKLPEELNKESSLMFAGNQIQPKKTVACLKGRRWLADYEEGLQKVYYKDDMIACIYAVADWFSPADVEEPVLEWVTFTDRKTYKPIKICDVPDIIYSEVMRDVDLAVSVAHAGGVDPETSHSTVEMRRVILAFNLELFGLHNVTFEKNHAMIEGKRGRYSVHLGSGVVHKIGGHQINIVAVQGSKRGKIFLPFIDEDPKTAEIMSKVLMFAEDDKIKDPYIMEQIMR